MFNKLFNSFYSSKDRVNVFLKKIYLASAEIKNKKLRQELEDACKKSHGVLTYAEYLHIEQYGKNGYHAHSKNHGATNVHINWGKAVARLCLKNDFHTIIEFGCGSGDLGVEIIKEYKNISSKNISWIGIEINKSLHKEVKKKFVAEKLQQNLGGILSTISQMKTHGKAIVIYPYSLDSIPPEIFINTSSKRSYPNALLGITIKNNKLHEVIIPENVLLKKGIFLKNGIYRNKTNQGFDISSWKLRTGQRAYIAPDVFRTVYSTVQEIEKSSLFVFIDEFRTSPFQYSFASLGMPKDLYNHSRECTDIASYYKNAGNNLFYFPLYFETFFKFLHAIGFRSINSEIEQKAARELVGKKWMSMKEKHMMRVILASGLFPRKLPILSIPFYPKKIF